MNRQELEEMLSNPPSLKDKKIYIWGTGNTASLYQESLARLEQEGSLFITGYVDNNSSKWGGAVRRQTNHLPTRIDKAA